VQFDYFTALVYTTLSFRAKPFSGVAKDLRLNGRNA
jgi:hypothetical protein